MGRRKKANPSGNQPYPDTIAGRRTNRNVQSTYQRPPQEEVEEAASRRLQQPDGIVPENTAPSTKNASSPPRSQRSTFQDAAERDSPADRVDLRHDRKADPRGRLEACMSGASQQARLHVGCNREAKPATGRPG